MISFCQFISRARPLVLALACLCLPACQTTRQLHTEADSSLRGDEQPRRLQGNHPVKQANLARELESLSPIVDPHEARLVASVSLRESEALAGRYRVVRPALLHNVFVHAGWRQRGLCFHWADDLNAKLTALPVDTLDFHRSVAYRGRLREHNAVVVTAKDQAFESGLVLDPWKYGGDLGIVRVQDARHPWLPFYERPPGSRVLDAALVGSTSVSEDP